MGCDERTHACATLLTFTAEPDETLLCCSSFFRHLFFPVHRPGTVGANLLPSNSSPSIFGFRDATAESATESRFLAVPDPKLAEEHLRILTQAPHMAGTVEDKATADYVAQKFRAAGLDTEIVEYKVWINYPLGDQRRPDRARRSRPCTAPRANTSTTILFRTIPA